MAQSHVVSALVNKRAEIAGVTLGQSSCSRGGTGEAPCE